MENFIKRKYILITILVILGLLISADLAYIYYQANYNQYAFPSFCSISEFIDCDGIARTTESQFLGVPLAYWGILLYSFIGMLLCVDFLKKIPFLKFLEVFKNKFHYIAALGFISFTISMILLCVSIFHIHKLCYMCCITYVINLCIGIVAVQKLDKHIIGAVKQSWEDLLEGLKPLPYRIAFIAVMICAVGFLGWATVSAKFSPALKFSREIGQYARAKHNKYAVKGNLLGSEAKDAIILHVYSDYQCPICYASNIMIHRIAKEFSNIRVEHHSLPLDTDCNKYLTQPFHQGSCISAKYADAAAEQGKFWEVHNLFFEKKPQTEEKVLETLKASNIQLDMDKLTKDAKSKNIENKIQDDIEFAAKMGQIATPAMRINADFQVGVKGYPDLKKWVISHGGKLKKGLF